MIDVAGISRRTIKQDELFEYADAPDYLKEKVSDYYDYEYGEYDFELDM